MTPEKLQALACQSDSLVDDINWHVRLTPWSMTLSSIWRPMQLLDSSLQTNLMTCGGGTPLSPRRKTQNGEGWTAVPL